MEDPGVYIVPSCVELAAEGSIIKQVNIGGQISGLFVVFPAFIKLQIDRDPVVCRIEGSAVSPEHTALQGAVLSHCGDIGQTDHRSGFILPRYLYFGCFSRSPCFRGFCDICCFF